MKEDTVFCVFIWNQHLSWLSEARDQGLMSERRELTLCRGPGEDCPLSHILDGQKDQIKPYTIKYIEKAQLVTNLQDPT